LNKAFPAGIQFISEKKLIFYLGGKKWTAEKTGVIVEKCQMSRVLQHL
jgi:hypothetical protein